MKSLNYTIVCVVLLTFAAFASQAKADLLYKYDFESLTTAPLTPAVENLTGQVSGDPKVWQLWTAKGYASPNKGLQVVASQHAGNSSTAVKMAQGISQSNYAGNSLDINPITFTSADTSIFKYVQLLVDGTGTNAGNVWSGFNFEGTRAAYHNKIAINKVVVTPANSGLTAGELRANYYPNNYALTNDAWNRKVYLGANVLTRGHWYEFQGEMDFSTYYSQTNTWGSVKISARDLTAGETDYSPLSFKVFTVYPSWSYDGDAAITNILPMGLTKNASEQFVINGIGMYTWNGGSYDLYADNISLVTPIPEPSTFALLAAGLVGLLAYAWRKRK